MRRFLEERLKEGEPLEPRQSSLRSNLTVKTYLKYARVFLRNVLVSYDPPLDEEAAKEFLRILSKRRRPRTVMVYYSAIKNLYYANGWSFNLRWTAFVDPTEIDESPEEPYLTAEEMRSFLEKAIEKAERNRNYRDAMIIILLALGLRPRELSLLKVGDLKPLGVGWLIEYHTIKRGGKRKVQIPNDYSKVVNRWLRMLEQNLSPELKRWSLKKYNKPLPPELPLFPRYFTPLSNRLQNVKSIQEVEPIGYETVYATVKKYSRVLGLDESQVNKITPYAFRRGVVTTLLEQGVPEATVDRYMGWKTPMARRYYKKSRDQIAREILQYLSL